jgi:hypothetical protein
MAGAPIGASLRVSTLLFQTSEPSLDSTLPQNPTNRRSIVASTKLAGAAVAAPCDAAEYLFLGKPMTCKCLGRLLGVCVKRLRRGVKCVPFIDGLAATNGGAAPALP